MSHEEISCNREKLLVTGRNSCHSSCHRKKYLVTGRNFLSQEEIPCQRQKCPVTGRNFLSEKETSCHRTEFHATVKNFLSQQEIPTFPLCLLSHLIPAGSGEIFDRKYWLPQSRIFHPTLSQTPIFNVCSKMGQ